MKTVRFSYKDIQTVEDELAICLGYFDGVHLGHQKLIETASKKANIPLGILTFDKPISSLIDNGKSTCVLTSLSDRFKAIERYGLDYYFVLEIDKDFLEMTSDEFVETLKKMNVKKVFVGSDYRFGKNRLGNPDTLKKHFDVTVVDLLTDDGQKIGSQRIMEALNEGDLKEVSKLLGRNYMVSGTVNHGKGIGTNLGFPTANISLSDNYALPRLGVYQVIAYLDGVPARAIANVGVCPTFNDSRKPVIEVHLINKKIDVYGKKIDLEFLHFIRPEIKFSSKEELIEQISKDIKELE